MYTPIKLFINMKEYSIPFLLLQLLSLITVVKRAHKISIIIKRNVFIYYYFFFRKVNYFMRD